MRIYRCWSSRTLVGESYKVHKLCQRYIFDDVPLVEFMYILLTRMLGESHLRRLRFLSLLLCLYDVSLALINCLVC